jgi:hypothetical protein
MEVFLEGCKPAGASQGKEGWASAGFKDAPTSLQTEFKAYGVSSLVGEAQGSILLTATPPSENPSGKTFLFWAKPASQAVNNAFRTAMIKSIYPNWDKQAWTVNTNGGGH